MSNFVGLPSYAFAARDRLAFWFLAALSAVSGGLTLYSLVMSLIRPVPLRFVVSSVVGTAGFAIATRFPAKRLGNGRLESKLDGALGHLPNEWVVFAGRPFELDAVLEGVDRDDVFDMSNFTLTDRDGRVVGSRSPDRVVVGPGGLFMIKNTDRGLKSGLSKEVEEGRVAEKRLFDRLRMHPLCKDLPWTELQPKLLVAIPPDGVFLDVSPGSSGRAAGLSMLHRALAAQPPRLAPHALPIARALSLCYSEAEQEAFRGAAACLERLQTAAAVPDAQEGA